MQYNVKMGFVPNMRVPGTFYVNDKLKDLLFEELAQSVQRGEVSQAAPGTSATAQQPPAPPAALHVRVWHIEAEPAPGDTRQRQSCLFVCSACAPDTPCLHLCGALVCACLRSTAASSQP